MAAFAPNGCGGELGCGRQPPACAAAGDGQPPGV